MSTGIDAQDVLAAADAGRAQRFYERAFGAELFDYDADYAALFDALLKPTAAPTPDCLEPPTALRRRHYWGWGCPGWASRRAG